VRVDGEVVGEIGSGLCVLLGVAREDGEDEATRLADKVAKLRIFENEDGRFDRSSTWQARPSSSASSR
jgi:D-aminoacyl-tRNA deacylase